MFVSVLHVCAACCACIVFSLGQICIGACVYVPNDICCVCACACTLLCMLLCVWCFVCVCPEGSSVTEGNGAVSVCNVIVPVSLAQSEHKGTAVQIKLGFCSCV